MFKIERAPPDTAEKTIVEIREILGDELPPRKLFVPYLPKPEWFYRDPWGLHGVHHAVRVMIWQEILARVLIKKQGITLDQEALRWSASTHDVRRLNDGFDLGHGIRAGEWVYANLQDRIPRTSMTMVRYLNTFHVPPDWIAAPYILPELKVLKDPDAIDRVRNEDLNPYLLRHPFSTELIEPARLLFTNSMKEVIEQNDHVLDVAVKLRIIGK